VRVSLVAAACALGSVTSAVACAPSVAPVAAPIPQVAELPPMKTDPRGRIIIASQPSLADLRTLPASGVTDIVNLRTDEEMRDEVPFDEEAHARALGLGYVRVPLTWGKYRPEVVETLARVVSASKGKVLLHCYSGGRSGLVWAAYAVVHEGMSPDAAMRSLRLGSVWPLQIEELTGIPMRIERAEAPR